MISTLGLRSKIKGCAGRKSSVIRFVLEIEPERLGCTNFEYCVYVFSSHLFWTSGLLDVPAGVTQEEGHTGFLFHLPSAVLALIFLVKRIQSFLSLVDRFIFFSEEKSQLPGFELTSQRLRRFRGYQLSYRGDRFTLGLIGPGKLSPRSYVESHDVSIIGHAESRARRILAVRVQRYLC